MLKLVRKEDKVYCDGRELTIVKQATKGPGNEVVKIEGLVGSEGQKWISLSKLVDGENLVECSKRIITTKQKYELTEAEQAEVNKLQTKIDKIIEDAKARYVEKPNFNIDISKLSYDEKQKMIEVCQRYLNVK